MATRPRGSSSAGEANRTGRSSDLPSRPVRFLRYLSAGFGSSVFGLRDCKADYELIYSVALKKLISELPSMSEEELAAAGELGASAKSPKQLERSHGI